MQFVSFQMCDSTSTPPQAPLPLGKCFVYLTGTATLASLFDGTGSPISNPATADANAMVSFAAADGVYDYQFAYPSGTPAGPKLLKQQMFDLLNFTGGGVLYARSYGASPAASAATNTTAIQVAINAAFATGATLVFEPGIFQHNGLTWKNKVNARGAGLDTSGLKGTVLLYLGTGDGIQLNNPINSSTAANVTIEGITFKNQNRNAGKGCFADTGSTDLKFHRCGFIGSDRGLIFDQTELADVIECDFEGVASQTALIWLVNGADRTVSAAGNFTNRITVQRCQLNGGTGVIGIVDDGGATHAFTDNNYNGCLNHVRAAGVLGLTLSGGEWESAAGSCIILDTTALAGGAVGACSPVLFLAPIIVPTAGQHCVTIFSGGQLIFIAPFFGNTSTTKVNGTGNANSIFAFGVQNGGGGANFDGFATNHWELDHSNGLITNLQPALVEIASASVTNPVSGAQKLFIDTADHKLKRKDSSGTVTIIA